MSKFFAMLQDSFREAIDGWIFLVMLVLSGILILLVASASVEPLPFEQAIGKMVNTQAVQVASPNRGEDAHQAQFQFNVIAQQMPAAPKDVWTDEFKFTVQVFSLGIGGGVEMDDAGKPKKPVDGMAGLFSDPFTSGARYWAAAPGTPSKDRPKYTSKLGEEFLAYQLRHSTGISITGVRSLGNNLFEVTAKGIESKKFWPHSPSILFGAFSLDMVQQPLGKLVNTVENSLLNGIGAWILMLAGVIVTAGFVPNMLRKGAIDLLITKPMSRTTILLYKYFGGLMFVFLLCTFTIGGVWLVIGLRTGLWATGVLWTIPGITFYFAILYACSTLFGVLSRNAIVCIVVTIVFWFILYLIGLGHNIVVAMDNFDMTEVMEQQKQARKADRDAKREKSKEKDKANGKAAAPEEEEADPPMPDLKPHPTLVRVAKTLNAVTPRTNDLDALTTQAIGRGLMSEADQRLASKAAHEVKIAEVLTVSAVWIGIFLGFAILRFVTRSY